MVKVFNMIFLTHKYDWRCDFVLIDNFANGRDWL